MTRIINVKYRCCGYNFDAAIDCNWGLHCYDEKRDDVVPIELYNIDCPEWDIFMIYQKNRNDQTDYAHTVVDWDDVLKHTRKWVRQMKKK